MHQLEQELWTLRQNVADLEWELESRWGRDLEETRERLETILRAELDALRRVVVGTPPLTVYRLAFASIVLIAGGVVASTVGALLG